MANTCVYCKKDVAQDVTVKCRVCKFALAHPGCVNPNAAGAAADTANPAAPNVETELLAAALAAKWTCPGCRTERGKQQRPGTPPNQPTPGPLSALPKELQLLHASLIAAMDARGAEQKAQWKEQGERWDGLEKRFSALEESLKFMSEQYDTLASELKAQKVQNAELKTRLDKMSMEKKAKDKTIDELSLRVGDMEQKFLVNNFEIHGLEFQEGEDARAKVAGLANSVGVPPGGISDVYRVTVPRQGGGRPRVDKVVVKCENARFKNLWMQARKHLRPRGERVEERAADGGGRDSPAANSRAPPPTFAAAASAGAALPQGQRARPIRIYDELTSQNRQLLHKTRSAARELGLQFVWVKDGKILVKGNNLSPTIRITCEQDIRQKLGAAAGTPSIPQT